MPFDGVTSKKKNFNQKLVYLALVLRHKELWPIGFHWDYSSLDNCAVALYESLYSARISRLKIIIHPFTLFRIFIGQPTDSTPEHIADLLEEYTSKRK